MSETAFGNQIENVGRPVLDRYVLNFGTLQRDQLDNGAMQCCSVELGRRATLHVSHLTAFIGNDQGTLKLSKTFSIDPKVCLERVLHFHSRWYIDERTTAEDSRV